MPQTTVISAQDKKIILMLLMAANRMPSPAETWTMSPDDKGRWTSLTNHGLEIAESMLSVRELLPTEEVTITHQEYTNVRLAVTIRWATYGAHKSGFFMDGQEYAESLGLGPTYKDVLRILHLLQDEHIEDLSLWMIGHVMEAERREASS